MGAVRYLIKCDECGVCSEQARPLEPGEFWLCKLHSPIVELIEGNWPKGMS
ncbi:hypothetical protein KDJ07_gp59 [Arthrobacter phage Urla]|uniref:Uncharacterized protein n=1 Tax=Arthrobacter phage Urla TaxID=2047867 RepID=A0A2H4P965_9CAUD|nr:hypothetical protein KDJ07_gp59 [Arthrobacter phage Urla]ATW58773.1 hypothetical protein PHIRE_URLA_59 [Arthrobacter phage Urla]